MHTRISCMTCQYNINCILAWCMDKIKEACIWIESKLFVFLFAVTCWYGSSLCPLFFFFCCVIFTAFSLWVKNSYPSYFFSIKIHSTSITPPCTLHQTCISHFQLLLNSVASWLHLYLTCYFSFLFLNINPEIALIIVFFIPSGEKKNAFPLDCHCITLHKLLFRENLWDFGCITTF